MRATQCNKIWLTFVVYINDIYIYINVYICYGEVVVSELLVDSAPDVVPDVVGVVSSLGAGLVMGVLWVSPIEEVSTGAVSGSVPPVGAVLVPVIGGVVVPVLVLSVGLLEVVVVPSSPCVLLVVVVLTAGALLLQAPDTLSQSPFLI
jgi:hypothetical protein